MHMLVDLLETLSFVESSSNPVVLEHIQLKDWSHSPGVVHQGPPYALAMVVWVDEQPADLIPDQDNKAHHHIVPFENPRLGLRQIDLTDTLTFLHEKRPVEEGMADQ